MSLLLDALKKAADDKKKASHGKPAGPATEAVVETTVQPSNITEQKRDAAPLVDDSAGEKNPDESTEELTLDSIETDTLELKDDAASEGMAQTPNAGNVNDEPKQPSLNQTASAGDPESTGYTVSDEALQMLIDKTNREVKKGKRLMLISVLLVSVGILVTGGVYYYMDMQAEIAILERKHQIAKQSMRSKTNKEITPEKSEIIRNLVGESELDEKVQYAKKHMAEGKHSQQTKYRPAANLENQNKTSTPSSGVSFQRTNKTDPVAEKLDEAWRAYERADYDRAKILYKEVLNIETNNRDALLGLGAIAVIEKNNMTAKDTYLLLLKQDPRDPIAIAALASLRNINAATESDEKYLLNMLQKNPGDAHLNFALGNIYAQQDKWKQAQQSYFNALQADNENVNYMFNVAVSLDQLGKQEQAIAFYQDCLNKSGNAQVAFSRDDVQKRLTELSGM